MKDNILNYLEMCDTAKDIIEINDNLSLTSVSELEELQKCIKELVNEGKVHETKKNKYMLMKNCPSLFTGKLDVTKNGYAFLLLDDSDDLFISADNLNGAIKDDLVLVDRFTRNGKYEGKVVKILERKLQNVIGTIHFDDEKILFDIDDKKLDIKIKLNKNYFSNLVDGHKVVVSLTKQIDKNTFKGDIVKIIGHINDPNIDILTVACKYGITLDFSDEAKKELENIPDHVRDIDKQNRKDLTNEEIFTIDGDDTKDIDDAISIKKIGDNYELGVHIADVSYYVKPNMALYNDAYMKGTSSYLADRVLPMLPHELSNGICSLNEDVERLAISCVMNINASGKVENYDIFPSVIKSKKKMTYNNVNKILEENIIPSGYEQYADSLLLMNELSNILRKKMVNNGYIDFNIPEAKIIQDETGKCIDVKKREQKTGEKLIENFMIVANETVATHISNMELPFIYRIHGAPKPEKITDFTNLLKQLNINVNVRNIDNSSKAMQLLLDEIKDNDKFSILSSMLLRSMQKAIYSPNNIGHFGLSLQNYTHFTSPIRRFPDTTVHRLLRTYLFDNEINNETVNYFEKYLIEVADNSSEREQAAVNAEREVDDMKMAEYMESHINKEFEGVITSVTNFGFFVELPNLIEGLVHISTLKGYYNYVPEMLSLISDNKKEKYCIGDKVRVKVVGASKEMQTIDFEVI